MNKFKQYLEEVQYKKDKIYNEIIDPATVLAGLGAGLGTIGIIAATIVAYNYDTWKNDAKEKKRVKNILKILDKETLEISKNVFDKIFKIKVTNWEDIDKNSSGKTPKDIILFQNKVTELVTAKVKESLSEIDPKIKDTYLGDLEEKILVYIKTKAKRAGREYVETPQGPVGKDKYEKNKLRKDSYPL